MEIILLTLLLLNIIISIIAIPGILKKNNKQVVVVHKDCPIVGIVDVIFMSTASVAALRYDESIITAFMFYGFTLLGIAMIIAFFNCRITYNNTNFTVKNFFGIKKTYKIDDIIFIKHNSFDMRIYTAGKTIVVDTFSKGKHEFSHFLDIRYKSTHNGKPIPTSPPNGYKLKLDFFNGNVEQPESFIVVYCLIGLIDIALIALSLVYTFRLTPIEIEQQKATICLLFGLCIAYTIFLVFYIIMSIRIGRHPENYSYKVIHFFFKNGYVHKPKSK